MTWATVSFQSWFCWLYRASPSLAAEKIIKLISVLTICWSLCVEFLVLLQEGVGYDQCVLLTKLLAFPLLHFVLQGQSERKVKVKSLSHVQLFATPWTVALQDPLSMGFSRQKYWSGLPFPSPGDLPDPGIKPRSPALQANALTSEPSKYLLTSYFCIPVPLKKRTSLGVSSRRSCKSS